VVLWCLLDVFLGNTFFWWPEPRATLQIFFWGYDFEKGWLRNIPIEEFVFYITGFLAILMTYIWTYNYWLRSEDTKALETLATLGSTPLIRGGIFPSPCHYKPVLYGAILFALAFAYKKWFSDDSEGFPGYLLFLLLLIII